MMEDIRFVLESPQSVQSQKKRPRLVTSCDNCRLKKVKCIQHTPNDKCEACTNAQIACRFRDRERYFAERSRIMAGSGSDSGRRSAMSSRASSSSAGWNSSSNGTPSPDRDVAPPIVPSNATVRTTAFAQPIRDDYSMARAYPQLSWSEYPQCTPMTNPYTSQAPNTLNGTHWDYGSTSARFSAEASTPSVQYGMDYSSQPSSQTTETPLFDPRHPDRPHANLMAYFIQAFFDNLSSYFPFMNYGDVISQFFSQSLSPVLSSSIAALASSYVDCPEVKSLGMTNVQAAYCANAERLLASQSTFTFDTLHATILLAWAEHNRGKTSAFCFQANMAYQLAWSLGLSDESAMALMQGDMQQTMLRDTWGCVNQLRTTVEQISAAPPLH